MSERTAFDSYPAMAPAASPVAGGLLQRACACGQHTEGGACSSCSESPGGTLQRSAITSEPTTGTVPPIVHDVLNSPGQPLDDATRTQMEPRFGRDFSRVRVHADDRAADSAQAVGARAYTVGSHIVLGDGQASPQSSEWQRLLVHELTHTVQQGERAPSSGLQIDDAPAAEHEAERAAGVPASGHHAHPPARHVGADVGVRAGGPVLQRAPAPLPGSGHADAFDRSKVVISEVPDIVADLTKTPPTIPAHTVAVTFSDPAITHLTWQLYGPNDALISTLQTTPKMTDATSARFPITSRRLAGQISTGRYTLRCVGYGANDQMIAYADRSFFLWTSAPIAAMNAASLKAIKDAPAQHSVGEVGAAIGRSMMLEHRAAQARTGTGKYSGNRKEVPVVAGVTRTDCTEYVLAVLKEAFTARGQAKEWQAIFDEARQASAGQFKGTELLKALQQKAGWKAIFWAPDPRNPEDKTSEHPAMYRRVREEGKYRSANESTGITVDASKSVIDYRRTSPTRHESMGNLDRLRRVPLAVIAARGGDHMTLLINGQVYEVHWDSPATDPNVIEATPLEKWEWQSGVVLMPPRDYAAQF